MDILKKPLGGFFELELPKKGSLYHDSALALANGRVCFKVLLERVKPTKVFVPFYCCDKLVLPLEELKIPFEYYAINSNFDPIGIPLLADSELFVFINYFGLKNQTARKLSKLLGEQLVIDNTHAFFEKSYGVTWAFNSARKFFGVPDGGFLYSPQYLEDSFAPINPSVTDHLWLSFCGNHDEAFKCFQENEATQTSTRAGMSDLTKRILYGVDFPDVIRARKRNFRRLSNAFRHINKMSPTLFDLLPSVVPFCYPLLLDFPIEKEELYENKIYIPTFWSEILERDNPGFNFEKSLVDKLLPIPIDHRLEEKDIRRMVEFILELQKSSVYK
jgi:hypothetical protein